jgi:hypothetical protein
MGASLGGAFGGTSSTATGTSSTSGTYSPSQSGIQGQIGSNLSTDLTAANSGTLTPGTTAMETQAADQINKTSGGLKDRVQQFLAARGMGKSGQTGQTELQGELQRENAIGSNAATFAGQQQQLNSSNLLAALNYAFSALGSSSMGKTTGSGTSWGVSGGVSGGIPGFK